VAALYNEVMRPLAEAGPVLAETLDAYIDSGGAIEACARKLFVHPNTVRYRLKRIADFTGRDPTVPRDAYILRVATTVGRLDYPTPQQPAAQNRANTWVTQLTPPLVGSGHHSSDES
jgi:DNA-binding PucR family transcriptional regulator